MLSHLPRGGPDGAGGGDGTPFRRGRSPRDACASCTPWSRARAARARGLSAERTAPHGPPPQRRGPPPLYKLPSVGGEHATALWAGAKLADPGTPGRAKDKVA